MPEIILHHYASSTFSERVRLALGLKGLAWRSVTIPGTMPKPDLVALTGGYRRTPVLQVGADIYCDTLLILRTIERLHPEPSLYPEGSEGAATALGWWADKFIFPAALGAVAEALGDTIPADFVAERKRFGFALAPEDVRPVLHRHLQQGAAHLSWLAAMLSDGRPFLLGAAPCAADLAAHGSLWLLRHQGGEKAEAMLPVAPLRDWFARVDDIGHGHPQEMSAQDALEVAAAADPNSPDLPPDGDPSGLPAGVQVAVSADDTGRDPVRGQLVCADAEVLVIRTENGRVGALNLHFPRAGFDVVPV